MTTSKIRYLGLLPEVTTQSIKDAVIDDLYNPNKDPDLYTYRLAIKRFDCWRFDPPTTKNNGLHMCSSSEELLQIILMLNLGIPLEEIINNEQD